MEFIKIILFLTGFVLATAYGKKQCLCVGKGGCKPTTACLFSTVFGIFQSSGIDDAMYEHIL